MKKILMLTVMLISVLMVNCSMAVEESGLAKADIERLAGEWYGPLNPPDGKFIIIFRFEIKEDGELEVFVNAPAQGDKWGPVSEIELADGNLTLHLAYIGAKYKGKITGNEIVGEWMQGEGIPLSLKKGEYKPEVTLNISGADMEKLSGHWYGRSNLPDGEEVKLVYRFELKEDGKFKAILDIPDQGSTGMLFTEVEMVDGNLTLRMPSVEAEYKGKITSDGITGEWVWNGKHETLTLKKGK